MSHRIVGAIAAMLATLLVQASAAPTVTIGAEDDWAPYSYGRDGHARGFAVDVVREAYALAGVTAQFKSLPYSRCMAETKAGRLLACFDAVPNSLVAPHYLWPQQPLFATHMNVYARAGSTERNLRARDLEGRTVGVQRDYEYGDAFDLNTRIVRRVVDKNEHGFRMLQVGRLDFMAAEARIADALFRSKPFEFEGKFVLAGTVATPQVFIAFSKDAPGSRAMLELFNQGYAKLRKSPRYKELEDRWLK